MATERSAMQDGSGVAHHWPASLEASCPTDLFEAFLMGSSYSTRKSTSSPSILPPVDKGGVGQ